MCMKKTPSPDAPVASSPPAPGAPRRTVLLAALGVAAALAGCATTRLVEADVSSFGGWPENRTPGSYAFERLPSQQADPQRQAELEAASQFALEGAGFKPAGATAPDVRVQVAARTLRDDRGAYWGDPFWRGGAFYGSRWRGSGFGLGYGWAPTYYLTEVSLLVRDARTQQVLYETRAQHNGVWGDVAVRAALFEAAMKDFPRPAISPRRVTVQIAP